MKFSKTFLLSILSITFLIAVNDEQSLLAAVADQVSAGEGGCTSAKVETARGIQVATGETIGAAIMDNGPTSG